MGQWVTLSQTGISDCPRYLNGDIRLILFDCFKHIACLPALDKVCVNWEPTHMGFLGQMVDTHIRELGWTDISAGRYYRLIVGSHRL